MIQNTNKLNAAFLILCFFLIGPSVMVIPAESHAELAINNGGRDTIAARFVRPSCRFDGHLYYDGGNNVIQPEIAEVRPDCPNTRNTEVARQEYLEYLQRNPEELQQLQLDFSPEETHLIRNPEDNSYSIINPRVRIGQQSYPVNGAHSDEMGVCRLLQNQLALDGLTRLEPDSSEVSSNGYQDGLAGLTSEGDLESLSVNGNPLTTIVCK